MLKDKTDCFRSTTHLVSIWLEKLWKSAADRYRCGGSFGRYSADSTSESIEEISKFPMDLTKLECLTVALANQPIRVGPWHFTCAHVYTANNEEQATMDDNFKNFELEPCSGSIRRFRDRSAISMSSLKFATCLQFCVSLINSLDKRNVALLFVYSTCFARGRRLKKCVCFLPFLCGTTRRKLKGSSSKFHWSFSISLYTTLQMDEHDPIDRFWDIRIWRF